MDDADAANALTELGLSTYAARTFVGLQKIGVASASEVAEVTDVPRSQVYGAMGELEAFGLADVQEGSPKRYRPVEVEEAQELLYERLRSTADDAFDYLQEVQGEHAGEESREAIWTTEGQESITARVTSLAASAGDELLYATGELALIEGAVADALAAAAAEGADVTVVSADEQVRAAAAAAGLEVMAVEDEEGNEISVGRVLLVDADTVLLSVLPDADIARSGRESAFWSDGTGFATLLAGLVRDQFE
jgi:sugar-specific transcriptional regulator TrmB